jgi:tRNA-binding EMAP/Myf-like protein
MSEETNTNQPAIISYDDFNKLTIRIGTITAVEVVPDADKLLKLTVDFGDETRPIVSVPRYTSRYAAARP